MLRTVVDGDLHNRVAGPLVRMHQPKPADRSRPHLLGFGRRGVLYIAHDTASFSSLMQKKGAEAPLSISTQNRITK
jgi:hypothetical protein